MDSFISHWLHWGFERVEWGRSPAERALAVAGGLSGGEDPSSSQREGEPMHSSPVLQLSRAALGCFPLLKGALLYGNLCGSRAGLRGRFVAVGETSPKGRSVLFTLPQTQP
ncbi:hypothetical protein KIL84_021463 [Mauremys mutica]|uniref:Uncharacterized protein n=1 Tax=Mauremys mutica TaxID=74926 RepID=A0A9D4AZ08_9SAUR|nr:hypothetical protein KIL84_021463 [Mauremys mutica]